MTNAELVPEFSTHAAAGLVNDHFGLSGEATRLESYADQNFRFQSHSGERFVIKIANAAEERHLLEGQNAAMRFLADHLDNAVLPRPVSSAKGESIVDIADSGGRNFLLRLLTWVPGTFLHEIDRTRPDGLQNLGAFFGRVDVALSEFSHPATIRDYEWDLKNAGRAGEWSSLIEPAHSRRIVEYFLLQFDELALPALSRLRHSVIHNDGNEHNVLIETEPDGYRVSGLIDFGDLIYTATISEVAVATAYALLESPAPIDDATSLVAGYHNVHPLLSEELEVLYYLIAARLCQSVCLSAKRGSDSPDNAYITISSAPALAMLERLVEINPERAANLFHEACGLRREEPRGARSPERLRESRAQHIGKSLSLSYSRPLKIIRGGLQYLYDEKGVTYLDAVNNVPHVGHCHPRVVGAGQRQMAALNTNTRYLHDNIVQYAERLTATMPDPLEVCFFVCSGSEANDLAIRIARTCTGRTDVAVLEGAYHGTTQVCIELSPYKFDGPGGMGAAPHIHHLAMPDPYRSRLRDVEPGQLGSEHALDVKRAAQAAAVNGEGLAAFICEPILGCGGQVVLPDGYLRSAYGHARDAGALCIADEVQVGFGRAGSHFWAFETQGVVPDIVTLGKPMGNGHPLAAVVTTREIADAFANGMEYFNTFGGNPVSCAIGMAVLDVIEEEGLQENARQRGDELLAGLHGLREKHALVGDVRGLGLFAGVELVLDRDTMEPAAQETTAVVEFLKTRGVLISTDGPLHNVLKMKPPIIFSAANVKRLVTALDEALSDPGLRSHAS